MSSIKEEVNHLQIPLQELSDATDGFLDQNLIARGGFGKVYKGVSIKHGNIAVKMLDPRQGQGDHEFRTEIALLSVYKHENIVSLLGFCDEAGTKILVYKHESNGSLDKHLNSTNLTWIQRLQICLDAARGLKYLHDDVGRQHRILHRDIKSSNILLDENWKAKISDFGLSRMGPANMQSTFLISNACGTIGYIDPDYLNTGYLTQKSDVYSFGVVLFEVLCGRLTRVPKYKEEHEFLINLVKIHWGRKTLDEIIHPDLQVQIKTASLLTFSSIAYQCLMSGNERPTMKKVVQQLEKALDNQLAPSNSWSDDDDFAAHDLQGQSARLSASSSNQSTPAASSQSWKYDVFISFREDDTRKTFVDHIYSTLEDRQIFTYKDDQLLAQQEPIHPSHFKALQESRIAVIVFSPNYATSSQCLDELAQIMENSIHRGQIVITIFYDVDYSYLKTSYYKEELVMHNNNKKVKSWRQALVWAASNSGWDAGKGRHEKEMIIRAVCDNISHRLLIMMTQSKASANLDRAEANANTELIGIETRVQELKSLLKVGSGGVHMVGICGMWGSGKSALASSVYDQISHEFEGCCFVENVRDESRMHGLKALQEKILSNVLKSKVILKSFEQGIMMMSGRLCQNSFLIVLDDVDHMDQLKMLAKSKNCFGEGSRIMITTRNQDLLNAHNVIIHNVRMLDSKEATELFSRHAFGESKPVQDFAEVSLNMVSKCGGHPSAIKSLGGFLYGKDKSVWMSTIDRLEGISVDEVLKKLKIRDDGVLVRNIISDQFLT